LGDDERGLRSGRGKRMQGWKFQKCLGDCHKDIEIKSHGGTHGVYPSARTSPLLASELKSRQREHRQGHDADT